MGAILPLFLCVFLFVSVWSSPLPLGINVARDQNSLPLLTLPYATYRAASYNSAADIYTFKNIRFAAPPIGDLRWAKPAPPLNDPNIQDGSYGHSCVQSAINGLNVMGPGNKSPIGTAINQFVGGIPLPIFSGGDEDCLFLDVYVPGKAIKNPNLKLPVLVYMFGGAYVFGSKDSLQPALPFYDGSGMMGAAQNGMIFVSINYRLGAYGFLAGTTMEREGMPNAGLWDQRAAMEWVQKYISLVGGDPSKVTVMGESAGAGSIIHHLVAQGGKLDPLFKRAILLSPAYEYMWDRAGSVEDTFQKFAALAGCKGKRVACLRATSSDILAKANKNLMDQQTPGSFAVGPTADGSFIRQLPVLELSSGNYWKGIESVIVSHCALESIIFVTGAIETDAQFLDYVGVIFPNYTRAAGINDKIAAFYPGMTPRPTKYKTQSERVQAFIRDACFTCNLRHVAEALGDAKVYAMSYSVSPGWHGTDLIPTFYNPRFTPNTVLQWLASLVAPVVAFLVSGISTAVQSYFTSFVLTGDPNTNRRILNLPPTVAWPHPSSAGEQTTGVVDVGNWGIYTVADAQTERTPCAFWRDVAAAVTSLGGYAPPGAVVPQGIIKVLGDPSANFKGGNSR